MLRTYTLTQLTAAGTVTTGAPIFGGLLAVHVANNSAGTLTLQTATAPRMTLISGTAPGTAWYHPRVQICDVGGTAISAQYDVLPVADYVQVGINAAGTVNVTLLVNQP